MRCGNCGSEVSEGLKFCTNCGASLGEPTTEMEQVPPPAPPPSAGPSPAVAPKTGKKRTGLIVAILLIAILVVGGGAAAGIILWRVAEGNKLIADIQKVELKHSDGNSLNLKDVPLDTDLTFEVTFKARYKGGGKGTLDITLVDGNGDEVRNKSYYVYSSSESQTRKDEYHMTMSEGETFKVAAALKVTKGDEKQSDEESLEYYVTAGKGGKIQFKEAKDAATKKLEQATKAVKELSSLGIDNLDLTSQLLDATKKLSEADTADQANAAAATADAVIAECAARKAAQQSQTKAIDTCRANQTKLKQLIIDYYNANGNLPNSISDVAGLPSCPSGGQYTYTAPSTDPSTLNVSCSVHGSL